MRSFLTALALGAFAVLHAPQAQAQGYDGLFAAQSNYEQKQGGRASAPAPQTGGYAGVFSGGTSVPAPSSGASAGGGGIYGGAPMTSDFTAYIQQGGMKDQNQIRTLQRQSLEEAKKKRSEETRRLNEENQRKRAAERQARYEQLKKDAEKKRLEWQRSQSGK